MRPSNLPTEMLDNHDQYLRYTSYTIIMQILLAIAIEKTYPINIWLSGIVFVLSAGNDRDTWRAIVDK